MSEHLRVFLDANVLAAPLTRTFLLSAARLSGCSFTWIQHAEEEASRHMRPLATPVATVRSRHLDQMPLAPTADVAGRFSATKGADRQILADAEQSRVHFLVTNDVDDFAIEDLEDAQVTAVTADLFMSHQVSPDAYRFGLEMIAGSQRNPPITVEDLHRRLAKNHPRLFAAQNHIYGLDPAATPHNLPGVEYRGFRCLRCASISPAGLPNGVHLECEDVKRVTG